MSQEIDLNKVLSEFNIDHNLNVYGNGHINDTYCSNPEGYILQRINTSIFTDPDALMENIENVTSFIGKKIAAAGGDPERETLTVVRTSKGDNCYKYDSNNVFRVYKFIKDTKTVEDDKTLTDLYNAGKGFGRFQCMLDDFPVEKLHETIKDFHNTPKRVDALKEAIEADRAGRAKSVRPEIEFALENAVFADTVVNGIKSGEIPLRVTHNDTKINNILFDSESGEAVAVIDLDTVMPGSMLYDFGDALRMGGSTAAEDETNLDIVHFDSEAFKFFADGYLSETLSVLKEKEIELLPFSAKLLTYECGIRFLTDYLNGDTYFKIHREHHNLDRCRNQFKLVKEITEQEDKLLAIVNELI
jgi:hypothetical protein